MAEIDPVIVQLRADVAKYQTDVKNATRRVDGYLSDQEKSVKKLEAQIKSSTGGIANSFKSMVGAIGAGIGLNEVKNMADSYTRFTNSLKVAGLAGTDLASVQDRLFAVAQRNGVELESLGQLYSRAAQNQKELGASTEDVIQLTKAVAASLRISGTSTQEASGALLQLGQALGSPRVMAEEFNSVLEGMPVLLREASKYIDGAGGSLSGLTKIIKDQSGPGVSNVEFFNAIKQAMEGLEATASKTNLTISGAFTNLNNAMTKYIGEADKANGASAAVVAGLGALANNLDTVTDAIAVLAALMLGRFAAGLAATAAGSGVASAAMFAMQARAVGAATSMEALAFSSRAAGGALLAAFGGPVGLAVSALTLGIGYLYMKERDAETASKNLSNSIDEMAAKIELAGKAKANAALETGKLTEKQKTALTATANLTGQADLLATAWGRVAAEAKRAALEQARALVKSAAVDQVKAQQRLAQLERTKQFNSGLSSYTDPMRLQAIATGRDPDAELNREIQQTRKQVADAKKNVAASAALVVDAQRANLEAYREAESAVASPSGAASSRATGAAGKSLSEIAQRFDDDMARLSSEGLQAKLAYITDLEKRAEIQNQLLDAEKAQRVAEIENNKDYNQAQKDALKTQLDRLYGKTETINGESVTTSGFLRTATNLEVADERERRQKEAADNQYEYQLKALEAEADLLTSRKDKLAAEHRILAIVEKQEASQLEELIAQGKITDAAKARADLSATQSARRSNLDQSNASPMERARQQARDTALNINDAVENIELNAIDKLVDGLGEASTRFVKLGGIAGDVLNSIISDMVKLIAKQALLGGGGLLGNIFGSLTGARAHGGSIVGGQSYLVGENGPEIFRPAGSGNVVPNRMLNANASGGGQMVLQQTVNVDARNSVNPSGFAKEILAVSGQQAQQAAAQMGKTINQNIPNRISNYQRDGT